MFHSQYNQDKFLENNIFKGYKNGIFVDVGAHNGKSINNTLYFEEKNNWTGINIEPIEKIYNKLKINRPNCINLNYAVSNNDGETEFVLNTGYSEMLSGIKNTYDKRHFNRLQKELEEFGGNSKIINVKTKKLETIFKENNYSHVNYLSIDVEGAEFEVIKSINFEKVFIDVISFENNYKDTSIPIISYLKNKNFEIIKNTHDIIMINKKSQFYKKKNLIFIGCNRMIELLNCKDIIDYYETGIFIEANPEVIPELKKNLNNVNKKFNKKYIAINKLIINEDNKDIDFNIFSDNGCSSIYKKNKDKWPWSKRLKQINTIKCNSIKMSSLLKEMNWNNKNYDVIIDTQGAELEVLKSFDDLIDNINCLQVESSKDRYYLGQSTVYEVDNYLKDKNFVLINKSKNTINDIKKVGQGDLIYAKESNIYTIFKNYQESK